MLIRILVAVGTAVYKLCFRQTPKRYPEMHSGMPYEIREHKKKNRRVTKRYIEAPLESEFVCCLSKETALDRWLKSVGLGEELQTGDAEFDERIYIIADHPLAQEYLLRSADLREVVKELVPATVRSISITGRSIRFELPPHVEPSTLLDMVFAVRQSISNVQPQVRSRFADPFYRKALLADSFVWSVVGFAAVGWVEMDWSGQTHLHPMDLAPSSIAMAAGIAMIWMLVLKVSLGASSRTPKIVAESGVMMAIAVCAGAPLLISDLNTYNDRSAGWALVREVRDKKHISRRKGRDSYRLVLASDAADAKLPFAIPQSVEVDSFLFRSVPIGSPVLLEIGEGALGYPWFRAIEPYRGGGPDLAHRTTQDAYPRRATTAPH